MVWDKTLTSIATGSSDQKPIEWILLCSQRLPLMRRLNS
jgi:hypothetical protein